MKKSTKQKIKIFWLLVSGLIIIKIVETSIKTILSKILTPENYSILMTNSFGIIFNLAFIIFNLIWIYIIISIIYSKRKNPDN